MITLTRITDPAKLDEYFRFRYRIYNNSEQKSFLENGDGLDRDTYDDNAVHLGWYDNGRLQGCVRFIHPQKGSAPLYCLTKMPEDIATPARALMRSYLDRGLPFVEVSRICIDPARRELATANDFVRATMAMSHTLELDQALFTCFRPHAPFWLRNGFSLLTGGSQFRCAVSGLESVVMVYRHATLPSHILDQLPAYEASLQAKAA